MTPSHGTILIADDEEKILKRLGRALRDEGHEVVEATTIREAQKQLAERPFDLLVVDNVMPDMTGLELIREVSKTMTAAERPQIRIIATCCTRWMEDRALWDFGCLGTGRRT